jgi:hypothetical protein
MDNKNPSKLPQDSFENIFLVEAKAKSGYWYNLWKQYPSLEVAEKVVKDIKPNYPLFIQYRIVKYKRDNILYNE